MDAKVEKLLGIDNLYDPPNIEYGCTESTRRCGAHLFKRDVDYMVKDGKIVIVDEFTGRMMPGRRWSDGLHQAVEAKEGVKIERENQTLATITFQNYFRMYDKLAGMTGTAETEADRVRQDLRPRRRRHPDQPPMARETTPTSSTAPSARSGRGDRGDRECNEDRDSRCWSAPISIENLRAALQAAQAQAGIKHVVLNAKHHDAARPEIVAQAGRKGAVTIATNMAGRGTDIVLGGNPEFWPALGEFDPEDD